MVERKGYSMEGLPVNPEGTDTIKKIAQNRMTEMGHVHPYLVCPARFG